jgi:hypothetical protein
MNKVSAIEFIYDRAGQYIRPGSDKAAWLAASGANIVNPDKGSSRMGIAGCAIVITESNCTIVGNFKPEIDETASHIEFVTIADMGRRYGVGSGIRPFLLDTRFNPPSGRYAILDISGKRILPAGFVMTNESKSHVYLSSLDGIETTNNKVILEAVEVMKIEPAQLTKKMVAEWRASVDLIVGYRSGTLNEGEIDKFARTVSGKPFALVYSKLANSNSINGFFDYMSYLLLCASLESGVAT